MNEVGCALGTNEEAAKKRVQRAVERLRHFFTARGVALSATVIATTLSAHSVHAAPIGLAASVTVAAVKGSIVSASTLTLITGALKIMAWTKAKTAAVAVAAVIMATGTVTVAVKTGVFVVERLKSGQASETMGKANRYPRIFSNRINNAQTFPDTLYTYADGDEKARRYLEAVVKKFRQDLDFVSAIKSDREVTDEDLLNRTIFIYGSPANHSLFRRLRDQLPIVFENDGVVVGNKKYLGGGVGAIFVCPNPLNAKNQLVIYGTVSPDALVNMNGIFHGPTDHVVFNNTTRQFRRVNDADRFLLLGSFDTSDPAHWQVDEQLQLRPPQALQSAAARVVVVR